MKQMTQHEMRKIAMQAVYMANQDQNLTPQAALESVCLTFEIKEIPQYSQTIVSGVLSERTALDEKLSQKLKSGWQLSRLDQIDRAILEIGLYEIESSQIIQPVSAVNEALNLCDEFSEPKSKQFVNGVLANFVPKD